MPQNWSLDSRHLTGSGSKFWVIPIKHLTECIRDGAHAAEGYSVTSRFRDQRSDSGVRDAYSPMHFGPIRSLHLTGVGNVRKSQ